MFKIIFAHLHLEKLCWIIKSKLKYMILFALIGGILGGVYAIMFGSSVYRADITLQVYSRPEYASDSGVNITSSDLSAAQGLISSYLQVLRSSKFLNEVISEAGLEDKYSVGVLKNEVTASAIKDTAFFTIYVYDANPQNAQLIANTIGEMASTTLVGIVKSGGIAVLDEAQLPKRPFSSTSALVYAVLGAGAFGVMAAMVFILFGLQDTRIRRIYEIQDMFTVPIIGTVPDISKLGTNESTVLGDESSFNVREAYSEIRNNLLFIKKDEKCPVFAFTSADKGEGKTTSCVNVAKSLAKIGKNVLLIDADMRFNHLAEMLELSGSGLSDYLNGECALNIIKNSGEPDMIISGSPALNASDLVAEPKFSELLKELKKEYDMIILDLPPAGRVTDAMVLVDDVSAYVIVMREFISKFEREELVVGRIEKLEGEICGFIYNGISPKSEDYNFKKKADNYGLA